MRSEFLRSIIIRVLVYSLLILPLASPFAGAETIKPEVQLYMEGLQFENQHQVQEAAQKYQESLVLNPTFVLSSTRLIKLADIILSDHRKQLKIEPGFSIKPNSADRKAIHGPVIIKDMMPGYLMIYESPEVGPYAVFSLKSRHLHNVQYLLTREDETWKRFPSISLPGVSRYDDILLYHQPGEKLQDGFVRMLIKAFTQVGP